MTAPTKPASDMMKTQAAKLAVKNPELAYSPTRLAQKAERSFFAVVGAGIALIVLGAGALIAYKFAAIAVAQKQVPTISFFLALLIPLAPGSIMGLIVALRFDPDAGGVLSQVATTIGSVREAVFGKKGA